MRTPSQTLTPAMMAAEKSLSRGWFDKLSDDFEKSRFAAMTLLMTAQSCLGSIACFYVLSGEANTAMLTAGVMVTMMSNSLFISQSPAKWCVAGFIGSVVVNLGLIAVSFFTT